MSMSILQFTYPIVLSMNWIHIYKLFLRQSLNLKFEIEKKSILYNLLQLGQAIIFEMLSLI